MKLALLLSLTLAAGSARGAAAPVPARSATTSAPADTAVVTRTASMHPMRYVVSRPPGWSAARQWPVLVVISDAAREFIADTRAFAAARGDRPFLIVTPLVLTAGGTAQDHRNRFDFPDAAWARAARDGNCTFDRDGLDAVLADVRRLDHADSVFMLAAFEAGGHVAWAELFRRPDRITAAALVTPNYIGRCVDESRLLTHLEGTRVPIRAFAGERDSLWADGRPIYDQWRRARTLAIELGFQELSESIVPGAGHEFMAPALIEYFETLRKP